MKEKKINPKRRGIIVFAHGSGSSGRSSPRNQSPKEEVDYNGKVIFVIPNVGLIFKALSTPPISYIVILAAVAIIAIPMIFLHYYSKGKRRMQI